MPNGWALGALDLVAKHVVPQAPVIATPAHHSRPSQTVEEAPTRPAPGGSRDPPGHEPSKRAQKPLKPIAAARAQHDVQVRTHVGKVVDADVEPARDAAQHV